MAGRGRRLSQDQTCWIDQDEVEPLRILRLRRRRKRMTEKQVIILTTSILAVIIVGFMAFYVANSKELISDRRSAQLWTFKCINNQCMRERVNDSRDPVNLDLCRLTCGHYGVIWPKPTGNVVLGEHTVPISIANLHFELLHGPTREVKSLLRQASVNFVNNIRSMIPHEFEGYPGASRVLVYISATLSDDYPRLWIDEKYLLEIRSENSRKELKVTIEAVTFFGARHGLETLSQLVEYDSFSQCLKMVSDASITDEPFFTHRGILLDTARNFFSVESIKRTLNGMAANKLNTLHWHLTDTQSFPFQSNNVPEMSEWGAYSPEKVYTHQDLVDVVEHARARGVRIVPEIDVPGRNGYGWQWGPHRRKGDLALCLNAQPWQEYCRQPPCGFLNPANENVIHVLRALFRELLDIFPSNVFHFGGDDMQFACWNSSQEVLEWMNSRQLDDMYATWNDLQSRIVEMFLQESGRYKQKIALWESEMTSAEKIEAHINKSYIIQIQKSPIESNVTFLLQKGYMLVISNEDSWCFDCGFTSFWIEEDDKHYSTWQKFYGNDILNFGEESHLKEHQLKSLILGGEGTLWSDQVDEHSLDPKLWPRGCALAERLWSNPSTSWQEARSRLSHQRERLLTRGISPDALQPHWCDGEIIYCQR